MLSMVTIAQEEGAHRINTFTEHERWLFDLHGVSPKPNISFQAAVQYRKAQNFNVVMIISAFPNWNDDGHPSHLVDSNGYVNRQAWQ